MKKDENNETFTMSTEVRLDTNQEKLTQVSKKSKTISGLLAIFLGGFGAHKFYLGKTKQGVLYLIFCWTYFPLIISIFEGIRYFMVSEDYFLSHIVTDFQGQKNNMPIDNNNQISKAAKIAVTISLVIMPLLIFKSCQDSNTFKNSSAPLPINNEKAQLDNKNATLITITKEAVKNNLKAPSTAKFPWGFESYQIKEVDYEDGGPIIYWISGYVDAENSFGAKLRNRFVVNFEITRDFENYSILDVIIE